MVVNYDDVDLYIIIKNNYVLFKSSILSISYFKTTFKNLINNSKKKYLNVFKTGNYDIIHLHKFKAKDKFDKNRIEKQLIQKYKNNVYSNYIILNYV